ncbi:MAG: sulfatase-like hydrolase/transferase [Campylobacteraceae bacterium]|nr:sulfatase-like hydrolase/transferase [Campylobacteraceae bacterium]
MNTFLWISILLFIIAIATSRNRTRDKKSVFFWAFIIFAYIILSGVYIVSDYFTGEGINDAVIYHLRYGLDGSGFGDYYLIMTIGFGFFIASFVLSYFYYRLIKNDVFPEPNRIRRAISTTCILIALAVHPTIMTGYNGFLKSIGFENALSLQNNFADYYKTPSLQSTSEEHPNFVYIFAESFETTYFDEKLFPSLVTQLRSLREQNTYFTDIRQVTGTSWTIAGMTSTLCGLPLVTPSANAHSPQGNSMSKMSAFYSGATCMSDLLHKEGYSLTYRSGSSLEFAGVDKLYRTHKFDDIKGINELKPNLKNPSYQNPWGLYDDTLFEIAFNDFKKLSASKRKFGLFLSTMDTHHPYGHVSKSCKQKTYGDGSNSILNSIACSDELIVKFIKQIQDSPYGKNTVIVVTSDHLAMHNMAIDMLMKGERRDQFMIIDPRVQSGQKVEKAGSTLDVSATLLPFLGYKADMGLSRDLLSDEKSLVSEFDDVDKQLNAWTKDISRFWEFPKIEKDLELDGSKNSVKIGNTVYKFPILLRLNDNLEVSPFFEVKLKFFETTKLFGYLHDYHFNDTFVWVDKCTRISAFGEEIKVNSKGKFCFAAGKLGAEIKSGNIDKNVTMSVDELKVMLQSEAKEELSTQRKEGLMRIKEK